MEQYWFTENTWILQSFGIPNWLILEDLILSFNYMASFIIWVFASWDQGRDVISVYLKENYHMKCFASIFLLTTRDPRRAPVHCCRSDHQHSDITRKLGRELAFLNWYKIPKWNSNVFNFLLDLLWRFSSWKLFNGA